MRASTVGSRFLDRCGDSLGVESSFNTIVTCASALLGRKARERRPTEVGCSTNGCNPMLSAAGLVGEHLGDCSRCAHLAAKRTHQTGATAEARGAFATKGRHSSYREQRGEAVEGRRGCIIRRGGDLWAQAVTRAACSDTAADAAILRVKTFE